MSVQTGTCRFIDSSMYWLWMQHETYSILWWRYDYISSHFRLLLQLVLIQAHNIHT